MQDNKSLLDRKLSDISTSQMATSVIIHNHGGVLHVIYV